MPQIGNKKFPYTKEGIARYKAIKQQVGKPPKRRGPNDFKAGGPFARPKKKVM